MRGQSSSNSMALRTVVYVDDAYVTFHHLHLHTTPFLRPNCALGRPPSCGGNWCKQLRAELHSFFSVISGHSTFNIPDCSRCAGPRSSYHLPSWRQAFWQSRPASSSRNSTRKHLLLRPSSLKMLPTRKSRLFPVTTRSRCC